MALRNVKIQHTCPDSRYNTPVQTVDTTHLSRQSIQHTCVQTVDTTHLSRQSIQHTCVQTVDTTHLSRQSMQFVRNTPRWKLWICATLPRFSSTKHPCVTTSSCTCGHSGNQARNKTFGSVQFISVQFYFFDHYIQISVQCNCVSFLVAFWAVARYGVPGIFWLYFIGYYLLSSIIILKVQFRLVAYQVEIKQNKILRCNLLVFLFFTLAHIAVPR